MGPSVRGEQALVLGLWEGTEAGRGKERECGGGEKPSMWGVLLGCAWSLHESWVQQEEVWSWAGCGQGPRRAVARVCVCGYACVSGGAHLGTPSRVQATRQFWLLPSLRPSLGIGGAPGPVTEGKWFS